jgi:hypothetical protein
MKETLEIGSRRELFVDRCLVERIDGAELRLHPPVRREVVFQVEEPLENACTGCYNLCRDGDRILMYYRGYYPLKEKAGDLAVSQTTNLVVSTDGIHFERPKLGLVEFRGSKQNNIVYAGYEAHNFCVFLDTNPSAPPDQRFKAVGGSGQNNLHGFCSPDGLHWRRIKEGPLDVTGAFDSVNVPLWDPYKRCYRLFSRYFERTASGGVRAIQSCQSDDFIHWTKPVPHQYGEGVPWEHFYTNATTPCPGAEHILLSFPKRFTPERTRSTEGMDYPGNGLSDAVFITSRDGVHWDRTFMEAWVRPGLDPRNWTHRSCAPAVGIIQTAADEWSLYVSEHYGWPDNRLRRVTVRPHGFASASAGRAGGELVTRPVVFSGKALRLNYSTSAAGSVVVELQDESGKPLHGFAASDMKPLFGDELDAAVSWKDGSDLSGVAGKPVRFRFVLTDADLFAMRVGE